MQKKYGVIRKLKNFYRNYEKRQTIKRVYTNGNKSRTYKTYKYYSLEEIYHLVINVIKSHGYEYQLDNDSIYIKIPDVVCTNIYGQSQDITGMMIRICISGGCYIWGRRFSFTPEQWYSSYNHSHLSGFSNTFESFCFGSEINVHSYMNDYYEAIFHERLDWLLHYMPVYLSQESTNTNPYKLLSKVRFPGASDSTLRLGHNYLDYLDHVIIKQSGANITVDLDDCIDDILIQQGYGIFIDKETKKEFRNLDFNYKPNEDDLNYRPFTFRGKKMVVELKPTKFQIDNFNKEASPLIKQQIINKYESTINSTEFISACRSRTESEIINQQ